jgi:hypothetical protein
MILLFFKILKLAGVAGVTDTVAHGITLEGKNRGSWFEV